MTSEHGILQPNPALFDLEERKKRKAALAHELGEGAECQKCGDACPGFQLHFWRKVCINCRCGKAEHNVVEDGEDDPGFYFVGKIFDRPLRSRKEELEFCYGNEVTKFDWVPPDISDNLARRFLKTIPVENVPIHGTQGAQLRQQKLEKQFPVHDIEPQKCHDLTPLELNSMKNFVSNVRENVAGQGKVCEVGEGKENEDEDDDEYEFPPPPPPLVDEEEQQQPPKPPSKTFLAKPFYGSASSSSPISSRNDSPSSPADATVAAMCKGCKKSLYLGDVVVKADRAGPDAMWHPGCFKCSSCRETLVDLLYYWDNGRLYCARDFAVIVSKIPRCAACDELIFASEYTGAEDKFFHFRHFCCYECDRPLAGHKYIPVQGQPFCIPCFQVKYGKVCKTCGEYIEPTEQRLTLDSDHWHATNECFCCNICGLSLIDGKLLRANGVLLCSSTCKQKLTQGPQQPKATLV